MNNPNRIELVNEAASYFDLGTAEAVDAAARGNANRNYFVQTTTGKYVVKQILEHSEQEFLAEAAYVQHLDSQGFPVVPYLVAANSPAHITESGDLVAVMHNVPGEHPENTAHTASEIGLSFGALHTISYEGLPKRHTWLDETYLSQSISLIRKNFGSEAAEYEKALGSFDQQGLYKLSEALIHGDMDSTNCLFDQGKPKVFLDWEEASVGAAILDLATCIQNFCYDGNTLSNEKSTALMQSYETVRRLSKTELSYLPTAIGYVGLTLSVWSKLQFGLHHPDRPSNGSERLYWDRQLSSLQVDQLL